MFKPKSPLPAGADGTDAKAPSTWDKLLTTTPVVMTVVATLLAGLSSSEMTKAQYERSLAAQSQSKVGDQWAFFQAKRARGSNHDLTVKLLRAMTDSHEVDPGALQASAEQLVDHFRLGEKKSAELLILIDKNQPGSSAVSLRKAVDRFVRVSGEKTAQATALEKRISELLADPAMKAALTCLKTERPSEPAKESSTVSANPAIQLALEEISSRKSEHETEVLLSSIDAEALQQSIQNAEKDARAFDEIGKPISQGLGRIDKIVEETVLLARSYARAVATMRDALDQSGTSQEKAEMRQGVVLLGEIAAALNRSMNELNNNFMAAQLRYNGWRYEHEARDNQRAAGLYEIEVRKHSFDAERHRRRSAFFFYGMLAAQAGVTIATLALAVRLRSVLWGLASIAGLIAVCIAAYVYLYV